MTLNAAQRKIITEVAIAYAIATGAAALLYRLQSLPLVHDNLQLMVGALFLLLPQWMLRPHADIEDYGFTTRPRRLGFSLAALAILLIFPLFIGGFWLYFRLLCQHFPAFAPMRCLHLVAPRWHLPQRFGLLALSQLLVVALPEELLFRGYIQGRLEIAFPPQTRVLGARLGVAWWATAALFGLGHFLVTWQPQMLSRFFPGLVFGWLYARSRSIMAGTIFHAACNLLMTLLVLVFLT